MADNLPEPESRKEQYLAKAAGMDTEIPAKPMSREEQYLNAIAEGGGGGGGYVLPIASASTLGGIKVGENLSIDINGVLSALASGGDIPVRTLTEDDLENGSYRLYHLPTGIYVCPITEPNHTVYVSNDYDFWCEGQLALVNKTNSGVNVIFFSGSFGVWLFKMNIFGSSYERGKLITERSLDSINAQLSDLDARVTALEQGNSSQPAPSPTYPYTSGTRTYYLYNGVEVYVGQADASQNLYYASNNSLAIPGGEWGDNGDGTVSYIGGGSEEPGPEEPVEPDEPVAPEDTEAPAEG